MYHIPAEVLAEFTIDFRPEVVCYDAFLYWLVRYKPVLIRSNACSHDSFGDQESQQAKPQHEDEKEVK